MIGPLFGAGLLIAIFVGVNVGGSNCGVAFGPAVGSDILKKASAAALMTVFAFIGGWTVGRNVVETLGNDLVAAGSFTAVSALLVLVLIGGSMTLANLAGIPTSSSMTTVGVVAGLGLATNSLDHSVIVEITAWSLVTGIVAFWVNAIIGRYGYTAFANAVPLDRTDGPLLEYDRSGRIPIPRAGPGTELGELVGAGLVIAVACLMAIGAGANNVANVVAPLTGAGIMTIDQGVVFATIAIGIGAFTVGRRTLDTVSNKLTEIPLPAGLVVAVVSSGLTILMSYFGVPSSFVVIATLSVVGLGWGRAANVNAGNQDRDDAGESDLYDSDRTASVLSIQMLVPVVAAALSFLVFSVAPLAI